MPTRRGLILSIAPSFKIFISSSLSCLRRATSKSSILFALSSLSTILDVSIFTSITVPYTPGFALREVSFTSPALSPNIALRSLSSGESWVSPFGEILPTSISPGFTSAPILIIPLSSRSLSVSSPTLGMSLVISSRPSFVSRDIHSNSSIWIDVNLSSLTILSLIRIASSKLYPPHGIKATTTFCPRESSP